MPPKTNQARAWGTRYDTLPSSPPASPGAKRDETQLVLQGSSPSSDSQDIHKEDKEDKQPHDASIFVGRLVRSCCPIVRVLIVNNFQVFLQTSTKQNSRTSWLATFPSMPRSKTSRSFAIQKEVYALLYSVKYVSLQKCVQFLAKSSQDAASASIFLKSLLNSSPRPFLGRMLRYEPARAFRTLLISYRSAFFSHPIIVMKPTCTLENHFRL